MFKFLGFSRNKKTPPATKPEAVIVNTTISEKNVANTDGLILELRCEDTKKKKPSYNPADPKVLALRTLYAAWKQKPGLTEENARLLACSEIDITVSNHLLTFLNSVAGFLYVPNKNPPTVLSCLIMSALYQAYGSNLKPNEFATENSKDLIQYHLTAKQSMAILNFSIEKTSEKFEDPGNSTQFSILMRFGKEEQKALALHYLVGEFMVLDQKSESEKAARLACIIVKYYSLWVNTAPFKTKDRYAVFTEKARLSFPTLFALNSTFNATLTAEIYPKK